MPSPNFSKDITSIFNNSRIKFSLKLDMVCRLVCETLEAYSASMLMYSAKEDKLKCRGSYLSPKEKLIFETDQSDILEELLKNMMIYEFFDSQLYEKNIDLITVNDLKESIVSGKTFENYPIGQEVFENAKTNWKTGSLKQVYKEYKSITHEERVDLSNNTISGTYFLNLLSKDKLTSNIEVIMLKDGPQRGKYYFDILRKCGITPIEDNLCYIGLPLFATERYTGILRLIVSKDGTSKLKTLTETKDDNTVFNLKERLNNFAQLISLHLKTDYYLAGYRSFTNLSVGISENNLAIKQSDLQELCNTIVQVINCNGCLIRFNNGSNKDSPIQATSTNLDKYYYYTKKLKDSNFSSDINKILNHQNDQGFSIKAINFSIGNVNNDFFDTKEYYYDSENNLKSEKRIARRFSDFTPDYNRKLLEFKMHSVVVLSIDEIEGGVIILTNSANRFFISSDIEMLLLASKKIQLEIKLLRELERQGQNKLQEAQLSGMNIILHQFGQMIKTSADTIYELKDRINYFTRTTYKDEKSIPEEFSKILFNVKFLGFSITHSANQILRANRINEIDSIKPEKKPVYDFYTFIKNKCRDFEPYAYVEKEIHIWLVNTDRDFEKIDTDEGLLTEVIYNLLDNAVKYSFSCAEFKNKKIEFDPANYRSEGNILVKYSISYSEIVIEVTNWGSSILASEKHALFDLSYRGQNSKEVVGSGIGLYLCKKIVEALNGSITVESTNYKTTFQVVLKR